MSSTSPDCESTGKVVLATWVPLASDDTAPKPVTKLPSNDQCENSECGDDMDTDTGDMDINIGESPNSDSGEQSRN